MSYLNDEPPRSCFLAALLAPVEVAVLFFYFLFILVASVLYTAWACTLPSRPRRATIPQDCRSTWRRSNP